MSPRIVVTRESDSGGNEQFRDTVTGAVMNRPEFVRQIEAGRYPNYHVREVDGKKIPASNPDSSENNNLG